MKTSRMEAFSDGVLAIVITIMVLEMKVPLGTELGSLRPLLPVFVSYVLSFIYVGIYWNNHHHLLQAAEYVDGKALWANLHLLFWISLIPFTSGWMGENGFAAAPTALYGVVLLMAAVAWVLLQMSLVSRCVTNARLKEAIGRDRKGKVSLGLSLVGVALAFVNPLLGIAMYMVVAAMWFVPDRRFERALGEVSVEDK